ncbi:MAG: NADH:flavin oxidoreductase/NADH oxidase [Candidatus Protochlamydia sp.]|nr:NADH:flavin oxidoreductase/NADH oxidase [Candidatus Protochlamydia sp.]
MNSTKPSHSGCFSEVDHDRNLPDCDLLSPLNIRGVKLKNRIGVSPMCQYSSKDGMADDWHLVHLGSRAVGGAGLVFTEATAVTPQGRISPGDLGIWDEKHVDPLKRIVDFILRMGAIPGIQLAHAGRKGSCAEPWLGGKPLNEKEGGWPVVSPSAIPFLEGGLVPQELTLLGINEIREAFNHAVSKALKAGFKIIEIHAAHGYLLHEFLSPLSNHRNDSYGGSLENRMRLLCEIVQDTRSQIPPEMPLFVRVSATDWVEEGWNLEQSIELACRLKSLGVDLIDCSTGALVPHAKIPVGPNYQVPFAEQIKGKAGMMTAAVGLITEPHQANDIITSGSADLVLLAREFLREPYWGLKAQNVLQQEPGWPTPYGYAIKRRS